MFKTECKKLAQRNPENRYRYFPTMDDQTTWEILEEEGNEEQGGRTHQEGTLGIRTMREEPMNLVRGGLANKVGGGSRGTWNGGPRGTGMRGRAGRGRGRGRFELPESDQGWMGREFVTTREVLQRENEGEREGGPNDTDTNTNQAAAQGTDLTSQQEARQEPTNSRQGTQTNHATTSNTQTTLDTFFAGANRQPLVNPQ